MEGNCPLDEHDHLPVMLWSLEDDRSGDHPKESFHDQAQSLSSSNRHGGDKQVHLRSSSMRHVIRAHAYNPEQDVQIGFKLPMDEARQGYVSKKAIAPDLEGSGATRSYCFVRHDGLGIIPGLLCRAC